MKIDYMMDTLRIDNPYFFGQYKNLRMVLYNREGHYS